LLEQGPIIEAMYNNGKLHPHHENSLTTFNCMTCKFVESPFYERFSLQMKAFVHESLFKINFGYTYFENFENL